MYIEKPKLIKTFSELEENFASYSVPTWEELPDIELYMDQVISILKKYLEMYYETIGTDKIITSSMINNYVKLKAMPAPIKKKYSKIHIAYLIMISSLKQALSIPTIQKILTLYDDDTQTKALYELFCKNQLKAFCYITEKVCAITDPLLEEANSNPERMYDLAIQIAVSSNVFKMLSEDITAIKHTD